MEHLVTLHHVKMWLEDRREKVPESESDLIEKCKKIQQLSGKVEYKVINSDDLHLECKKARIRFSKEDADERYTREIFGAPSDNSPVLKQKESQPGGNWEAKAKKRVLKNRKKKTSSAGIENVRNIAQQSSLSPLGGDRTEPVREPLETSSIAAENDAKQKAVDVPDQAVSDTGVLILSPSRRQWMTLTNQCPILESASVNPDNPMNSIKAEVVDEMKDEETKSLDIKAKVPSGVECEMIDLTQDSKLSITEYKNLQQEKEKLREAKEARLEAEREAAEIVVLGQRKIAPTSRQGRTSGNTVKKEEPRDEDSELTNMSMAASDLLPVAEEVTATKVTDTTSELNPEIVYKKKVKEAVNDLLLKYYDNGSDKANKIIKIPNSDEFIKLCMDFSRQIREEIKETYVSMNGSLEGIEKVNVMEFGIDNIIHKYFESLPVLN